MHTKLFTPLLFLNNMGNAQDFFACQPYLNENTNLHTSEGGGWRLVEALAVEEKAKERDLAPEVPALAAALEALKSKGVSGADFVREALVAVQKDLEAKKASQAAKEAAFARKTLADEEAFRALDETKAAEALKEGDLIDKASGAKGEIMNNIRGDFYRSVDRSNQDASSHLEQNEFQDLKHHYDVNLGGDQLDQHTDL